MVSSPLINPNSPVRPFLRNLTVFAALVASVISCAGAAITISSTNFAWPTNQIADADLIVAENTNRPSPFKTVSANVANLFSNRTARGTWSFSGATVTGFAFATNSFTDAFLSGYVRARGMTGATNAPFIWQNTNGVAIMDFRTNNVIAPASDNVIGLGQSGNNFASLWTHQVNVGTSGNGDVRLQSSGSVGYLNFARIDGGTSSGLSMDGFAGARINMPNAGGTYQFYQNSKLVDIVAAGIRFPASNSIMFYSYNPSAVGNGFTQPDSLIRAFSNSTVVVSGTNSTGQTPLPTGNIIASNAWFVGNAVVSKGIQQTDATSSNYFGRTWSPATATYSAGFTPNIYYTNTLGRIWVSCPVTTYCPPSADFDVFLVVDSNADGTPDLNAVLYSSTTGTVGGALRTSYTVSGWINPGQAWGLSVSTNAGAAVGSSIYHYQQF